VDYRKTYIKIISRAKSENRIKGNGIYYEAHHILPKSLFPLWEKRKSNIVLLTAREHFFCHQLLVKIYPRKAMWCSLMFLGNKYRGEKISISSREYEIIKSNAVKVLKEAALTNTRKIICIETGIEYESIAQASRILNISLSSLKNNLKDTASHAGGLHFRYLEERKGENYQKKRFETEEHRNKVRRRIITNIINECRRKFEREIKNRIVCLETSKVYDSAKEAAEDTGCYYNGITRMLKGQLKSVNKLHFKYAA